MNQFIQSLESRTLFSAVDLTGDQTVILADAATVKTEAAALIAQNKTELATIAADVKALPSAAKANAPLLKTIKTDISKLMAATNSDRNSLLNSSSADAKKAVTAGNKLESAFTTANENAVTKDTVLLGTLVAPLGPINLDLSKFQLDLDGPFVSDLVVLQDANPSDDELANDVIALTQTYSTSSAAVTTAAMQYQTDLTSLSTDLSAVQASGPNILFDYSGKIKETAGAHIGKLQTFDFDITEQTPDGFWQATYSAVNGAGINVSEPASGTITDTGAFAGNLSDGTLFTGTVSGNTIKGTAQGSKLAGTFVATHT